MTSMFPGVWDGITNTFSNAIDSVKNWIGGKSKEDPPVDISDVNRLFDSPAAPQTHSDYHDSSPNQGIEYAHNVESPIAGVDLRTKSLHQGIYLLRLDASSKALGRADRLSKELREKFELSKRVIEVLTDISTHSDKKTNSYELKNPKILGYLQEIKSNRTALEIKEKYTKDERDALVRSVELYSRNLDTDMKLLANESQEALQQRNCWYEQLMSLLASLKGLDGKIAQGIASK